jgi:hypothetical protein
MSLVKEAFSKETLFAAAQTAVGFGVTAGGSRLVYRQLFEALNTPVGRVGTSFVVSLLQTLLLGMVGGPRIATRALMGGLIATGWQGLTEAVRDTKAAEWIPTLGEDADTASFRRALQREVLREVSGGRRAGAEGVSVYLNPAGVSDTYLQPAGAHAYLTQGEAERANMGAYLTQKEISKITGMGDAESEFSSGSAPERF